MKQKIIRLVFFLFFAALDFASIVAANRAPNNSGMEFFFGLWAICLLLVSVLCIVVLFEEFFG